MGSRPYLRDCERVPKADDMRELVQRATTYPYAIPARSFMQVGERTLELPASGDLSGRRALLAYGSNAAPEVLARKLAAAPDVPLPVIQAELDDFDVVYSAHVSAYGSVPATLHRSPGTTVAVHVAYPDSAQLRLLLATEPNYELTRLTEISCRLDGGAALSEVDAFLTRHACLTIDHAAVALSAIGARGRKFREMTEPEVLEHVRSRLFPERSLEEFIAGWVEQGGLAPLPDI